jgi:NADH:ubiquinone oxidoreductase subunit 2 (subunit N)
MFTSTMFLSILPETLILILAVIILIVEPFWKEEKRRNVGWLTASGLLAAMLISLLFARPGAPETVFGGMLRFDWLGFFFVVDGSRESGTSRRGLFAVARIRSWHEPDGDFR